MASIVLIEGLVQMTAFNPLVGGYEYNNKQ